MFETLRKWVHIFIGLLYTVMISFPQFHPQSGPELERFIANKYLVVKASSLPQYTHCWEGLPQTLLKLLTPSHFP
jgi:hypothetical protein